MMPPRKKVAATVEDLPPSVEAWAEEARSRVYQAPESLSIEAINRLLPDEIICIEAQDSDGAHRALSGPILSNTPTKLVILNVTTKMYTPPEKETIRFSTDRHNEPVPIWSGLPCLIRHPNERTMATIERIMVEKKHFKQPEETIKEKKQQMKELTPREIALAFLKVITKEPKGRGVLCKEAGMEVPKEVGIQVLEALATAGKISKHVEFKDGLKVIQWQTKED